jgi:hypothetical protein
MRLPGSKFRPTSGSQFHTGASRERAENAEEFFPKPT